MPLEKINLYFDLKHPKMTTPDKEQWGLWVRLRVLLSSSKCAFLLLKNALIFPELTFFPELPFWYLELTFCFPKVFFLFLKNILLFFQNCPLVFLKYLLFDYCACLFPRMLFCPADCTFSSSCSELLREIFALLLFCFFLKLFIKQLIMPS